MTTLQDWQTLFDAWAGQDPLIASTGEPSNPEEMASVGLLIGDWMGLDGSQRVLDVGCASGTLTSMWAPMAKEVVGVDFSAALLADARTAHSGGNMTFVHGEAAALPFADGRFDCVCTYAMMLCLPDHEYVNAAIDELIRVARPDARIVIGGLPDETRRGVFFDHCDAMTPWYRRAIPRDVRWALKRFLKPGSKPGQTAILWFDIERMVDELRQRGFDVQVENDPELSNYAVYRKTLILSRGDAIGKESRV